VLLKRGALTSTGLGMHHERQNSEAVSVFS